MLITERDVQRFAQRLRQEEKSAATTEKYRRETARFARWLDGREADREQALSCKEALVRERAPTGVNGAVAALNCLFAFLGLEECRLKAVKVQRQIFRDEAQELTRAEYQRLLDAAKGRGSRRLLLVMETICATGIRVSELRFFTLEAVQRGRVEVIVVLLKSAQWDSALENMEEGK